MSNRSKGGAVRSVGGAWGARAGCAAALIAAIAVLAPASAAAGGEVTVPRASQPQVVETHAAPVQGAPASAPAVANGDVGQVEPESSVPGSQVPSDEDSLTYPGTYLPSPFSRDCVAACPTAWRQWYLERATVLLRPDPAAAAKLMRRVERIDAKIAAGGEDPGDPEAFVGSEPSPEPIREPLPENGVQFGWLLADPNDPTDLGIWDLYTPAADFAALTGSPVLGVLALFGVGPLAKSIPCADRKALDGKVPVCPS